MMPTNIGSSSGGMVGLDMSLHHTTHRHPTTTTTTTTTMQPPPPQQHHFLPLITDDPSQHQHQQQQMRPAYQMQHHHQQQQQTQLDLLSEDNELVIVRADDTAKRLSQQQPQSSSSPSPSPSPWHRMKWTDNMVRLLIMIVYCIGDDGNTVGTTTEAEQQHQPSSSSAGNKGKKTPMPPSSSSSAAAGAAAAAAGLQLLQKKGKWKSVSRAMMEKGFYVSPQQCEDKFNDLNKRYKRVNELLGKGTACRVVENQALLDSMDHLSPRAKEEARKLLNSKHLFFREMCAYHNSGGSVSSCTAAAADAPASNLLSQPPHPSPPPVDQSRVQQHCFHHASADSSAISLRGEDSSLADKGSGHHGTNKRRRVGVHDTLAIQKEKENHDEYDDDGDEDDDDDDEEAEEDYDDEEEEEEDDDSKSKHHRGKKESTRQGVVRGANCMPLPASPLSASPPLSLSLQSSSPVPMSAASMEQLKRDLLGSLDGMGGVQQQRQWLKRKAVELEEKRVGYQSRALELKRQRFKWLRFSSNKEREMERMKLSNERLCLENDRMLLWLRQKEQELIKATANADHLHHNQLH